MKKILLALMAIAIAISFTACSSIQPKVDEFIVENNLGDKQTTVCYSAIGEEGNCEGMYEFNFSILGNVLPTYLLDLFGIQSHLCVGIFKEEKKIDGMVCYTKDFIKNNSSLTK